MYQTISLRCVHSTIALSPLCSLLVYQHTEHAVDTICSVCVCVSQTKLKVLYKLQDKMNYSIR